jgi:deoxyribose-phosphate aldolase
VTERSGLDTFATDTREPLATLAGRPLISNRGIPLNLDWLQQVRVNTSAVERRAQSHGARRTVKKDWQAAWLLRAVSCMDLTTLSGDDTEERVRRLCAKARHPIQDGLVKRLGIEELNIKVAAVCVYHAFVETAVRALAGSGVRVAAVSTGFPAGLSPLTERIAEIRRSVEAGANDIDVVITRAHVFGGKWQALYDEIAAFKRASGPAHMKVILGTGDLLTLRNVARASFVAMMAGADFIKTSTGKEPTNATLPVGFVMTRAIREAIDRMVGPHERGTWPVLDEIGIVPLWSQWTAERHRAATRTLRYRALFGRLSPSVGVAKSVYNGRPRSPPLI